MLPKFQKFIMPALKVDERTWILNSSHLLSSNLSMSLRVLYYVLFSQRLQQELQEKPGSLPFDEVCFFFQNFIWVDFCIIR